MIRRTLLHTFGILPLALAAFLCVHSGADAQFPTNGGSPVDIINAADPPLVNVDKGGTGTVWDVAPDAGGSIVTRDAGGGTVDLPSYVDGDGGWRCEINGNLYDITSVTSGSEFVIDDTNVTETDQVVFVGPRPALPNDSTDDTEQIIALFEAMSKVPLSFRGAVYFPSMFDRNTGASVTTGNGYQISGTITVEGLRALRIFGDGFQNTDSGLQGTRFIWTPASAGPLMHFKGLDGLICDGLNFVGNADVGTLVKITDSATDRGRQMHFRDCGFRAADVLIELHDDAGSVTAGATADNFWTHCKFDGDTVQTSDSGDLTKVAIWNRNEQAVNYAFNNCFFTNLNRAIWLAEGGTNTRVIGGSANNTGELIFKDQGGQNTSQIHIQNLYHDQSGERRMILYRSDDVARVRGPVTIRGITWGTSYPSSANSNNDITDITGTTITVADPWFVAVGDVVEFYDAAETTGAAIGTATITAVNSTTDFDVDSVPGGVDATKFVNEQNTEGFSVLESYTSTTVKLRDDIEMAVGHEIAFYLSSDYDTQIAITEVTAKTSNREYTVADTAVALGVDGFLTAGTLRAAHGTPLIWCTGGERVYASDLFLTNHSIRGGRLARLTHGLQGGGARPTVAFFERLIGLGSVSTDVSNLAKYIDNDETNGSNWYRFTDVSPGVSSMPVSFSNLPNAPLRHNITATAAPTVNDDVTEGYEVGSQWVDETNNRQHVAVDVSDGAAIWNLSATASGTIPPPGDPNLPSSLVWQFRRGPEVVGTTAAIVKQPGEELKIAANFAQMLGPTESLSTVTSVDASANLGVTITNSALDGNFVTFDVTGGNNLQSGPVEVTVTNSAGATIIAQGVLRIQN